jgi:NhaA family Na+:H+ antiporter
MAQCINVMDDMGQQGIWRGQAYHNAVSTLEAITERMLSPAQRLERDLLPWSTYLIMPVFALANAGVNVTSGSGGGLTSPISLGIVLGLVVGKPAGVMLFSFIAVRMGWARLPDGVSWQGFFGAAWLAGIGFTLSLFIAGSAFSQPELLDTAKVGILIASALATALGVFFLWTIGPTYHESTQANGDIIALADIETAPSRVEGEGLN